MGQLVRRVVRPHWVEQGWIQNGNEYRGYYRTRFGSYEGAIVHRYEGRFDFFIYYPPDCLWEHSHNQCFVHLGGDTYRVHFSREGRTIDDGILAIEKILAEALSFVPD